MSDEIRPFQIGIAQADLDYLHDRLANAHWPGELTLFPYTTLFRSIGRASCRERVYDALPI